MVRRVVTGVNQHGRSCVVSDEQLEDTALIDIWSFEPRELDAIIADLDDDAVAQWLESAAGGAKWMYAVHPPASEAVQFAELPGLDPDGFHVSRTVDFVFMVTGELTMRLDEEDVHLSAGDAVVQRAARHAWLNERDTTAALLALMLTPAQLPR